MKKFSVNKMKKGYILVTVSQAAATNIANGKEIKAQDILELIKLVVKTNDMIRQRSSGFIFDLILLTGDIKKRFLRVNRMGEDSYMFSSFSPDGLLLFEADGILSTKLKRWVKQNNVLGDKCKKYYLG